MDWEHFLKNTYVQFGPSIIPIPALTKDIFEEINKSIPKHEYRYDFFEENSISKKIEDRRLQNQIDNEKSTERKQRLYLARIEEQKQKEKLRKEREEQEQERIRQEKERIRKEQEQEKIRLEQAKEQERIRQEQETNRQEQGRIRQEQGRIRQEQERIRQEKERIRKEEVEKRVKEWLNQEKNTSQKQLLNNQSNNSSNVGTGLGIGLGMGPVVDVNNFSKDGKSIRRRTKNNKNTYEKGIFKVGMKKSYSSIKSNIRRGVRRGRKAIKKKITSKKQKPNENILYGIYDNLKYQQNPLYLKFKNVGYQTKQINDALEFTGNDETKSRVYLECIQQYHNEMGFLENHVKEALILSNFDKQKIMNYLLK
ncbi:hypothetical protein M0812_12974 [Anaeramoeba flamelloides]|uniref:Uncharacterized protein n=1 Tax=Anaeramoeba flamelloides TaxID=1746091 RepID=A0AAV7ZKV5_9EUKA|nr:hypothetical protein M0812_12974 [Anaeramoeba flamelloides]